MKTYCATNENYEHQWYVVDATNQVLGRLATQVAKILRGKNKPEFTPHVDAGDYVIIINADKIKVTGNKQQDKIYHFHSGFPGGMKDINFDKLQAKDPCRIVEIAVRGMLPKNALGRACFRKLKIYTNAEHPHTAQQPQVISLEKEEN